MGLSADFEIKKSKQYKRVYTVPATQVTEVELYNIVYYVASLVLHGCLGSHLAMEKPTILKAIMKK